MEGEERRAGRIERGGDADDLAQGLARVELLRDALEHVRTPPVQRELALRLSVVGDWVQVEAGAPTQLDGLDRMGDGHEITVAAAQRRALTGTLERVVERGTGEIGRIDTRKLAQRPMGVVDIALALGASRTAPTTRASRWKPSAGGVSGIR